MSFLCRVAELSLRERMKILDVQKKLGVEPLLHHVGISQLRWIRHLIRMPSGCLLWRFSRFTPNREETPGGSRIRWRD